MAEEDNVFEIEQILESLVEEGVCYYRVRWKGFGEEDDTWEPQDNLFDCKHALDQFWKGSKKPQQTKVRKRGSESTSQTVKTKSRKKRQGRTTNNSTIVRIDSPTFQGKTVSLPKEKQRKSSAKQTKTKRKHVLEKETHSAQNDPDTKRKNKSAKYKAPVNSVEKKNKRKKQSPKDSFPESKLDPPLQQNRPSEENPPPGQNQNVKEMNLTARIATSSVGKTRMKAVKDETVPSSTSGEKVSRFRRENSRESLRVRRSWSSFEASPEYVPEYCDETLAYDFVSEEEYEYFGETRYIVKESVGYGENSSVESAVRLSKDESLADCEDKTEAFSLGGEILTEEESQANEDVESSNDQPTSSLDTTSSIIAGVSPLCSSVSTDIYVEEHPFLENIQQPKKGGFKCTDDDTVSLNSKCNQAPRLCSETEASQGKNGAQQTDGGGLDCAGSHSKSLENERRQETDLFSVASLEKSDIEQHKQLQIECLDTEPSTPPRLHTDENGDVLETSANDNININRSLISGGSEKTEKVDHYRSRKKDDQMPGKRASASEQSAVLTDNECMSPEFVRIPEPRRAVFDFPEKLDGGDTKARESLTHAKRSLGNEFEKDEAADSGTKEVFKIDLCLDLENEIYGQNNEYCQSGTESFQEDNPPDIVENEVDSGLQSVCGDEIKNNLTDRSQNLERKSADSEKLNSVGLERDCHNAEKKIAQDVVLDISESNCKTVSNCGEVKEKTLQGTSLEKPRESSEEQAQNLPAVKSGITSTPEIIEIDTQSTSRNTSDHGGLKENSNLADVERNNSEKLVVTENISGQTKKPAASSEMSTKRTRTRLRLSLKRKSDKRNDESFGKKCKQLPLIEEGSQEVLSLLDKSTKSIQEVGASEKVLNKEKLDELKSDSSVSEKKEDTSGKGSNVETGRKDLVEVIVIDNSSQDNLEDRPDNAKSTKIMERDSQKRVVESVCTTQKLHRQETFSVCDFNKDNREESPETVNKKSVKTVDGSEEVVGGSDVKRLVDDTLVVSNESSVNQGKSIEAFTVNQTLKQKLSDDLASDALLNKTHLSSLNKTGESKSMTKDSGLRVESQKNDVPVTEKAVTSDLTSVKETLTSSVAVEQKSLSSVDEPSLAWGDIVDQQTPGPVLNTEHVSSASSVNALSWELESVMMKGDDDKTETKQIAESDTPSSMQSNESEIVSSEMGVAKTLEVSHAKDVHPHFTQAVARSSTPVLIKQSLPSGGQDIQTSTTNIYGYEGYQQGNDYVSWSSDTSKTYPYSTHSSPSLVNHFSHKAFRAGADPFLASPVNQESFLTQPRYSFTNQAVRYPFSTLASNPSPNEINQKPFSAVAGINWYPEHKNQLRPRQVYSIPPQTFAQRPFFVIPSYPLYSQQVLYDNSYSTALQQMANRSRPENLGQLAQAFTSFNKKEHFSSIDADKAWYAKHVGAANLASLSKNNKTYQSWGSSLSKEHEAEGSVKTLHSISQTKIRTKNSCDTSQSSNIKVIRSESKSKDDFSTAVLESDSSMERKTSLVNAGTDKSDYNLSSPNQSDAVSERRSSFKDKEKFSASNTDTRFSSESLERDEKFLLDEVYDLTEKGKNLRLEETSESNSKNISNLSQTKIGDSSSVGKEKPTDGTVSQFSGSYFTDAGSQRYCQSGDKSIDKGKGRDKDSAIDKERDKQIKSKENPTANSDSDRKSASKSSLRETNKWSHKTKEKPEDRSSATSRRGGSKDRERSQDSSSSRDREQKERRNDSEKTLGKDKVKEFCRNKEDASKTGLRSKDDDRWSKRDSKGKLSELKREESIDSVLEFDFDDFSPTEVINEPGKAEKTVTHTGIPTAMPLREVKTAIKQGDAATVLASLAGGMNVDSQDSVTGMTLLMRAVSCGKENIVKLLLNHGANINIKNITGSTALIEACEQGFDNIVSLLLNAEIDINAKQTQSGETALIKACMKGHYDVVAMLLAHGADSQMRSVSGLTAAQLAVQCGQFEIRDLLESHNKKLQRCVETAIASCLCDSNKLMYPPLLPFVSLYPAEGQKFTYHFHCSNLLLSKTILLFCLRAVFSRSGQVDLSFAKDNGVHTVLLNGSLQSPVLPNIKSVFVLQPKLDTNRLVLQTYQSHVHLLVCIYATELDENILNVEHGPA